MIEKLIPLAFPPGLFRNGTQYQAKARWYNAQLVRFFEETIRPVGGWSPLLLGGTPQAQVSVSGLGRGAFAWVGNDATQWLAVGTNKKLYAYSAGGLTDITPSDLTAGQQNGGLVSGGYGYGGYGLGPYGTGQSATTTFQPADIWHLDNFGEFLVACFTHDARILSWPKNTSVLAAPVAGAPTSNIGLVVTPERFLFVLGAGGNKRLVQWPDQGTLTTWTPSSTNQAGSFEITSEGALLRGMHIRRSTLLWTDADVWAASYIGGQSIYRFEQVGQNCGLFAPLAVTAVGGVAYWMGYKRFFLYDGSTREIPCEVADYVFGDLNATQRTKIFAIAHPQYNEVWWFYPSESQSGLENDRYVIYNYAENHWCFGSLPRSAGVGRGVFDNPILVAPLLSGTIPLTPSWDSTSPFWTFDKDSTTLDGAVVESLLYEHEVGSVMQDVNQAALTPFLESGPLEIGIGDLLARVQHLIPDEKTLGDVNMFLFGRIYPTDVETTYGPFSTANPTSVRLTARQVRVMFAQARATDWRIGTMRLGALPSGRR